MPLGSTMDLRGHFLHIPRAQIICADMVLPLLRCRGRPGSIRLVLPDGEPWHEQPIQLMGFLEQGRVLYAKGATRLRHLHPRRKGSRWGVEGRELTSFF